MKKSNWLGRLWVRIPVLFKMFVSSNLNFSQLTVFRCSNDRDQSSELDEVIMTALFKAQHLSPVEQLSLALAWNRCDIAKKEIFVYGNSFHVNSFKCHSSSCLELALER